MQKEADPSLEEKNLLQLRDMEWVDEKEAQQTPIIGVRERFSSLKENSIYLEAAKNVTILCGTKDGVNEINEFGWGISWAI